MSLKKTKCVIGVCVWFLFAAFALLAVAGEGFVTAK